ncbi:hypothetical protein [Arthrobacter sp. H41]|uniref:hypothetical protein n=1 Tax=Arthrobacter sp. H41 TaxID=1312978 RepID=UPI00047CC04E|nr:hypothetical protein [Arthrobacter sp. H41]
MLEIGKVLRRHFGRKLSFPTRELPKFVAKASGPAMGLTRDFVERNVGWPLDFDNTRARAELGIDFRPADQTIVERYPQMIDDKMVRGNTARQIVRG